MHPSAPEKKASLSAFILPDRNPNKQDKTMIKTQIIPNKKYHPCPAGRGVVFSEV